MLLQPFDPFGFVQLGQISVHRDFAHLAHRQQERIDGVAPRGADVRVALVAGENRQYRGAQHIVVARRVGTGECQGAALHPRIEQSAHMEKLGEERRLSARCDRCCRVKLDMYVLRPKGMRRNRPQSVGPSGPLGFTRRLKDVIVHGRRLVPEFQRVESDGASFRSFLQVHFYDNSFCWSRVIEVRVRANTRRQEGDSFW